MAFQCTVVTPEQQAFDASITQAILPAHDGLIGILTGRAPLLVRLGTGPLRLDLAAGRSQYYFVDGGVAQMKNNKLTIGQGARALAMPCAGEAGDVGEEVMLYGHPGRRGDREAGATKFNRRFVS